MAPRPAGLPPVHAVAAYEGPVREAVVAFKDHQRWSLRTVLGGALARSVAGTWLAAHPLGSGDGDGHDVVVLVPVPGSPGSSHDRDGDHVRELALAAARVLRGHGLDVRVVHALAPVRRRRDQVGLGRSDRASNLDGSMAPTTAGLRLGAVRGATIVLVDDVVTSGATLAEAARASASIGLRPAGAAVVAATAMRHPGVTTASGAREVTGRG